MSTRRRILVVLLAGCLGAWLVFLGLGRLYREEENYSLIEEGLYMGGYTPEPPPGTQVVINLCAVPDPYGADEVIWEPIPDRAPGPSMDWLRRLVDTMDSRRRAGQTVF